MLTVLLDLTSKDRANFLLLSKRNRAIILFLLET